MSGKTMLPHVTHPERKIHNGDPEGNFQKPPAVSERNGLAPISVPEGPNQTDGGPADAKGVLVSPCL